MSADLFLLVAMAAVQIMVAFAGVAIGILNSVKANQIHALANSNLTKVQSELKAARVEIAELQSIVGFIAEATKGNDHETH